MNTKGQCIQCQGEGGSIAFFVFLSVLVILALIMQFWLVLRSSKELLEEAKYLHERKEDNMDEYDEYGVSQDAMSSNPYNAHTPPPPPPSIM